MEEGLLADVAGEHFPSLIPQNDDLRHVLDVFGWRPHMLEEGHVSRLARRRWPVVGHRREGELVRCERVEL